MAPKNFEEALIERIQRALAKELKRLRRRSLGGNGRSTSRVLTRQAEAMSCESDVSELQGRGHKSITTRVTVAVGLDAPSS